MINYEYPESLYNTYRDDDGCWEWRLPFDPNQQDVTGQTSLYIASILGNKALVHMLLNWKVKAHKISPSEPSSAPITPTRKRISFGIQAIMSKLNISGEGDSIVKQDDNTADKCPINLNLLCGACVRVCDCRWRVPSKMLDRDRNHNDILRFFTGTSKFNLKQEL